MRLLCFAAGPLMVVRLQAALTAHDISGATLQNTPITIPAMANVTGAGTNSMGILQVTRPAHGKVVLSSNVLPAAPELSRLFRFAGAQLSNSVVQIGNTSQYPRATQTNAMWTTYPAGIYNWASGFLPGSLWYLYEQTGDANFRGWAESWMQGIAPMQYRTEVDDVGFMVNPSFGNGYRITGNADWRAVLLQTAGSFSTRYNAAAHVLSTWGAVSNAPVEVFLDTLMNLAILWRAYDLGGNTNLFTYAYSHAEQTMLNHVRPDGSTFHIVDYDPNTGAVLFRGTFAGASDSSTWARGQAWGIYGFAMAYGETGDARFLMTAQRLADYYLANVPADYVPYWDFQAPGIPNAPRDSSAASITLAGLLQLTQVVTNLADSARYWQSAYQILASLQSTNYLAEGTPSSGILLHGTGEPPQFSGAEVNVSLIYGDYYLIEALHRYSDLYRRRTMTYTPAPGFQGSDTFAYQVGDGAGNCSAAGVTVVVEPAPTSPSPISIALPPPTGGPTVTFPTAAGCLYDVEWQNELPFLATWSCLATNLVGTGFPMSVSDSNSPFTARFYRVGAATASNAAQIISSPASSGSVTAP
jgi:hypothetical protein